MRFRKVGPALLGRALRTTRGNRRQTGMRDRNLSHVGRAVLALVAVFAFASSARATLLNPNTSGPPSLTASPVGSAQVADSGVQPFASVDGSSFTGSLRTRVYTGDANNPFGVNALTFTWLIVNNGPDPIEQL